MDELINFWARSGS